METEKAMQSGSAAPEETRSRPQPPTVEEKTFAGALFGFRRKEVLEYVRTMSEQNESYIRTLDDSIASLQQELADSRQESNELGCRVEQMNSALEANAEADAKKQAEYDQLLKDFQACREKLFQREQKYVQLQKECGQLRAQNEEITGQVEKAREKIRQHREQMEAAARRQAEHEAELQQNSERQREQLQQQHDAELADTRRQAEEYCRTMSQEAAAREQAQRQESERQLQSFSDGAQQALQLLRSRADAEQERLARHVEQVDADLNGLKTEMEHVQQQIWAAHAMINQATQDMRDLLQQVPSDTGGRISAAAQAAQTPLSDGVPAAPAAKKAPAAENAAPAAQPAPPHAKAAQAAASPRQQQTVTHTTVRGVRTTVADHVLDALSRLWEKK